MDTDLVKKSAFSKSMKVNSVKRKNVGEDFGGSTITHGSVKVEQYPSGIPFKFHVIEVNVELPADG